MNNAVKINRAAVRAADRRRNARHVGTNAHEGSPCARCKKTACPDPCYPQRDWNRHHGKAPAGKPRTGEGPAGKPGSR